MEALLKDLRYAFRMLTKNPGFAAVAVLTLALGIGANTAIFSVVNAVMLRPLAYKEPSQLVVIWGNNTLTGNPRNPVAAANFVDFRNQNQVFEQTAAYLSFTPTMTLTGGDEPRQVTQSTVSASLFQILGVNPLVGRSFLPEEEQVGHDSVVMLSYGLWQRYFGGDPNIEGQTFTLSGTTYTVVGVMPREFYFLYRNVDIWLPLSFNTRFNPNFTITNRAVSALGMIGRLKPGVTLDEARANMTAIASGLEEQYPQTNRGLGVTLVPLHEQVTEEIRPALLILLGAVGFVLLVASANVATLLLARAASRRKEIAIRTALGAGRLRLIRQLLTESVLLALLGGALGLLLAVWGVGAILSVSPSEIPRQQEIGIDFWVLGFTLCLSILTGMIFGLAPTLETSKLDLSESLKEGGRASHGFARNRLRSALVISEIALTLVLLVGAGLLIRSFSRVMEVNPGFNPQNVLTMGISLPASQSASPAQATAFYDELFRRIESLPGVRSVGAATRLPLTAATVTTKVSIEGREVPVGEQPEVEFRRASRNYFSTLAIPLVKGRFFTEQDTPASPPAVIVNESAARHLWADEDPLGKRIRMGPNPNAPWETIVGVVGDIRHFGLDSNPRPELYIPFDQAPPNGPYMVVRTDSDPLNVAASIRAQVQAMNKDQALSTIQTMNQILETSVAGRRFNMLLLGLFAGLALLLASVGLYGVISYSVSQRTQEIGIRMALGASSSQILKLVVGQGLALISAGVGIGLIAAFGLTRVMTSLLFGVSATDPLTFVGIPLLLASIALFASYIPARRATKVDPMVALRYE